MVEQLFGSKTRVKLLNLFYSNPNRAFYVREITRKIDEQINSVRRELSNLLSIGIIVSETNNNRLYYEINHSRFLVRLLSAGTSRFFTLPFQSQSLRSASAEDLVPTLLRRNPHFLHTGHAGHTAVRRGTRPHQPLVRR